MRASRGALYVRRLGQQRTETLANIAICLHQADYLLDRQIKRPEKDFVQKGGLLDRMTKAHLDHRKK